MDRDQYAYIFRKYARKHATKLQEVSLLHTRPRCKETGTHTRTLGENSPIQLRQTFNEFVKAQNKILPHNLQKTTHLIRRILVETDDTFTNISLKHTQQESHKSRRRILQIYEKIHVSQTGYFPTTLL